jgi:hypothetical protein
MKFRSMAFRSVIVRPLLSAQDAGDSRACSYATRARSYQLAAATLGCDSLEQAISRFGMARVWELASSDNAPAGSPAVSDSCGGAT